MEIAKDSSTKYCEFKHTVNGRKTHPRKVKDHRKKRKGNDSKEDRVLKVMVNDILKDPRYRCYIGNYKNKLKVDEPCCALLGESTKSQATTVNGITMRKCHFTHRNHIKQFPETQVKVVPEINGTLFEIPEFYDTPPSTNEFPYNEMDAVNGPISESYKNKVNEFGTLNGLTRYENNKNKSNFTDPFDSWRSAYEIKDLKVLLIDCEKESKLQNPSTGIHINENGQEEFSTSRSGSLNENNKNKSNFTDPFDSWRAAYEIKDLKVLLTDFEKESKLQIPSTVNEIAKSVNLPSSLNNESPKDSGVHPSDVSESPEERLCWSDADKDTMKEVEPSISQGNFLDGNELAGNHCEKRKYEDSLKKT